MKSVLLILLILACQATAFAQKSPITVFLAGDSTMAEKKIDKRPETGWGEMLQHYFDPQKVKIENHAQNGRSTKSFIAENRWQTIVDKLKPGDYVFIQFGHNDEKADKPQVFAAANTDYRNNLIRFVRETQAKKALPVLLTPIVRRRFDEQGVLQDTHGEYPDAVRTVARELRVPLIDMQRLTAELLANYGAENSKKLFLHLKPKENSNYPNGVEDNTHLSPPGAEQMANLAIARIKEQKIGLRKHLKR